MNLQMIRFTAKQAHVPEIGAATDTAVAGTGGERTAGTGGRA